MIPLKKIKLAAAGALMSLTLASQAHAHGFPRVWNGWHGGYAVAWGLFAPWPVIVVPYVPYGFSYLPYFNNNPYYSTFGAIAYSPSTGMFGNAWGQATQFLATNAAVSYCGHKDCQTVVWVQGGCAAVASGPNNTPMTWAYHPNRSVAEFYATRSCNKAKDGDAVCQVRSWVCSF